jgi:hypothetical protein
MSEFTTAFEDPAFEGPGPAAANPNGAFAAPAEDQAPALVYPDPIVFFTDLLAPSYVRGVNNGSEFLWCPEWYKHPEALARMECIWRAWEHLRLEPALGLSIWWLHHADPHMSILMSPGGPFRKCGYEGHKARTTPEELALPHRDPVGPLYP